MHRSLNPLLCVRAPAGYIVVFLGHLKALVKEDTLLPRMFLGLRKLGNICFGHKMFLNKTRNILCVPGTTFVSATNVVRAGKRGNICIGNNVSATKCPRSPGPWQTRTHWCRHIVAHNRDFKIHYGGLLLLLLRPWGTRLTTPFPPQTSNRLRFRCTATRCSASTCLTKNGYVRLYSTFIRKRLDQWEWFPSLVLILHLPELRFASQLL